MITMPSHFAPGEKVCSAFWLFKDGYPVVSPSEVGEMVRPSPPNSIAAPIDGWIVRFQAGEFKVFTRDLRAPGTTNETEWRNVLLWFRTDASAAELAALVHALRSLQERSESPSSLDLLALLDGISNDDMFDTIQDTRKTGKTFDLRRGGEER